MSPQILLALVGVDAIIKIVTHDSIGELKMTALEVLKIADWQTLALLGGAVVITAITIYYIIIGRIDV